MPLPRHLSLALLAALPLLSLGLAAAALWFELSAPEQMQAAALFGPRAALVLLIGLAAALLAGILASRLRGGYTRAIGNLAAALELRPQAAATLALSGPAEVQALVRPLQNLLQALQEARAQVHTQAQQAGEALERERNQLAALIADLPQSVLACNRDGRVLLYNARARALFGANGGGACLLGLGRPLADVFERRLLAHTAERLLLKLAAGDTQAAVSFVASTVSGRLLRVRVSTVLRPGEEAASARLSGYMLIAEDVSRDAEEAAQRDQLLENLRHTQRAGLAAIRSAADTLLGEPALPTAERAALLAHLAGEADALAARIDTATRALCAGLRSSSAMDDIHAPDLVVAAQRRIEARSGLTVSVELAAQPLWLRADSFTLIQVLSTLALHVQEACAVASVTLSLVSEGQRVCLQLAWQGLALSHESAMGWELEPMVLAGESSPQSIREVLARHDGELLYVRERAAARACFRLLLPQGRACEAAPEPLAPASGRPEYYDFDLFAWSVAGRAEADCKLGELVYTVFDTETTGLDPRGGDEIIQIGALHIVNGRLLSHERFSQLVDPGRDIDPAAQAVHGFTRERLRGQPRIETVLPAFHAFARGTVLVGHNAAFDLCFLQLKEAVTALRFEQAVLDTLLLSALLHPAERAHSLEAIAERFGLAVSNRHDALADAMLTGQLFLRMIPLLAERGIHTLAQARDAAQTTYYARLRY